MKRPRAAFRCDRRKRRELSGSDNVTATNGSCFGWNMVIDEADSIPQAFQTAPTALLVSALPPDVSDINIAVPPP